MNEEIKKALHWCDFEAQVFINYFSAAAAAICFNVRPTCVQRAPSGAPSVTTDFWRAHHGAQRALRAHGFNVPLSRRFRTLDRTPFSLQEGRVKTGTTASMRALDFRERAAAEQLKTKMWIKMFCRHAN